MKYYVKFSAGDGYYFNDYTRSFENKDGAMIFAKSLHVFYKEMNGFIDRKFRTLDEVKVISFEEEMVQ